jgi:hypothetical protein
MMGARMPANTTRVFHELDAESVDDANLLLPLSRPWNGKSVGCYIRNSTAA